VVVFSPVIYVGFCVIFGGVVSIDFFRSRDCCGRLTSALLGMLGGTLVCALLTPVFALAWILFILGSVGYVLYYVGRKVSFAIQKMLGFGTENRMQREARQQALARIQEKLNENRRLVEQ
jgi:hypothetical protein